jgi:hypothetical protein
MEIISHLSILMPWCYLSTLRQRRLKRGRSSMRTCSYPYHLPSPCIRVVLICTEACGQRHRQENLVFVIWVRVLTCMSVISVVFYLLTSLQDVQWIWRLVVVRVSWYKYPIKKKKRVVLIWIPIFFLFFPSDSSS